MIVESVGDIIKLSGELTSNQFEAIRTAAGLVLKRHPGGVVIDCSGLTGATDAGAETFYDLMMHIERKKARIIVASVPEPVREALTHVPEVRSRLPIAESVAAARQSLDIAEALVAQKGPTRSSTGKLILALSGGPADSYAIALAVALAQMRRLSVVALFAVVVPQALPTTSPMPEQEKAAEEVLQRAKDALEGKDVDAELKLERTRSLAAAVERLASEMDERTAIISLPEEDVRLREPMKTADELLAKLSAEVILVRQPK